MIFLALSPWLLAERLPVVHFKKLFGETVWGLELI